MREKLGPLAKSKLGQLQGRKNSRWWLTQVTLLMLVAGGLAALAASPENLQEALQAQRALVAADPGNAELLNDLGNLLALGGRLEESEEAYLRALEIRSDDITALYNLSLVLQEQGKTKQARDRLQTVIEIDPDHAWANYQLGTVFAAQKDRTKALRYYERAFALDRSLTSPKVNPHIVENKFVTAALLQMYVSESPSTQSPRLYQQPKDVAELLLPTAATSTEVPAAGEAESRQNDGSYDSTSEPAGVADDSEEGISSVTTGGGSKPQTLDATDLRSSDSASRSTGSSSTDAPTQTDQGLEGGEAQSATPETISGPRVPSNSPPSTAGDSATEQGEAPSDLGGSFLPGLQSTGRLELELLPASEFEPMVDAS